MRPPGPLPPILDAEWLRNTFASIGDAVITTDISSNVTFINPVAQSFTGWTQRDAVGTSVDVVLNIVHEETRERVESPTRRVLQDDGIVALPHNVLLISKNGTELAIDDSAARIRDATGEVVGAVLVFRDITQRRIQEKELQRSLALAESIIATLRDPFVVLDESFCVQMANTAFYLVFNVSKAETEKRSLFELGNGQWNRPQLRKALEDLLRYHRPFEDVEVEHDFPALGRRIMYLNARRIVSRNRGFDSILLAIEDGTERHRLVEVLHLNVETSRQSEVKYRRLFESAKDGILILDENTGKITDANPFMTKLLGYDYAYFIGKQLWEIGMFSDIAANQKAFQELQQNGFIRYDHLPLETKDKRHVDVEFVSNSYEADGQQVIQCNIRDCSERFRFERAMRASLNEKEVLLKEVHHRVKNNLQVISSLLHLQSQHTDDEKSIALFRASRDRVRSMALVHERLYRSKDLAQVDFTDYIQSLTTHLFNTHHVDTNRITLKVNVRVLKLSIDAAIPCGLLLNELISNCLKHAFHGKERGRIRIDFISTTPAEILLSVSDDGVGLPPDIEPLAAQTFGMQLVADLVGQLHGRIDIIRDVGTTVRIVIPISK